ncbi:restriction endonuclease subunit S [Terribacillus sp. 179-K 1B1 HS]|uniref:restriction endonuclease subunit S n=1 Tax=Terribacillus sp. 179-K 1B1 HS TaxID=3142388 RepID=UPI0039A0C511
MEKRKKSHDWIGQIPLDWQRVKLKYAVNPINEKVGPESYLKYVGLENIESKTGKYIVKEEISIDGISNTFKIGDILYGKLRPYLSKCTIANFDGKGTTELLVLRQKKLTSINRFIKYVILNDKFTDIINSSTYGAKMPRANWEFIGEQVIPLPPIKKQILIADYLDKKTSEIDALIADKENLIKLLEEKRQAIITEAVTKGLNPDVKMKGSGVDWIGEIPEHWGVKKLGFLGRTQNGISKSSDEFGFGTPFVSYGDVYRNMELPFKVEGLVNATQTDKNSYSVKKGDVLFTRTSETIEEIGIASTCIKTIEEATFAGFLIRFRPTTKEITPEFSKYYFRSNLGRRYFVKEMNIVTRASLSQDVLKGFSVLIPPNEEQIQIAEFLDFKTNKIKESIELLGKQINTLKEYRQSLIYEVVTGKIDVRDNI